MKKIFSLLAAVLFAGSMMAADQLKVTLDFTDNTTWQFPVGSSDGATAAATFSDGTYTIGLAATTKYYYNTNGYLMLGKEGSTLTLPAFDFKTTKIVVTGNKGASASVGQNIFVGETAVSTQTVGAADGSGEKLAIANEYAIAADYQAAGNVYVFKVTTAHNTQITKIEVYTEAEGGEPVDPVVEPALFKAENVEADAETSVVAASSALVDDALLKVENVYESFVSGTNHTYAVTPKHSIEFQKALQVRASTYPAGEDLIGENNNSASTADNKKASPLVLTAKEDVDVVFYYRRQSSNTVYEVEGDKNSPIVSVTHDQNDSKDLIVYDQADIATKMVTDTYILVDDADKEYAFAAKGFSFKKGHVYTLTAKGTTLPFFGFEYAVAEPDEPVVVPADTLTCAAAAELALAGNTEEKIIKGYVTEIVEAWSSYKNVSFWMADAADGGQVFEAFRVNCETEAEAPIVGDLVWVKGNLATFTKAGVTIAQTAKSGSFGILEAVERPAVEPEYPIVETYFTGVDNWDGETLSTATYDAAGKKITVNIAVDKNAQWKAQVKIQGPVAEAGKEYNVSLKMKANHDLGGVTVKYQDQGEMLYKNDINLTAGVEFTYGDLATGVDGNGILVLDFGYAKAGDVIEIYDIDITEIVELEPITCAEVYALAKGDEVLLNDVVVTFVSGANIYVKDETGSMLLYLPKDATVDWKAGDTLSYVAGTLDVYNGLYEVKPSAEQLEIVAATAGEAPAPEELAQAPVAADMNKYVVLKNVTVSAAEFPSNKNMDATIGTETFILRNQFNANIAFDTEKAYDIIGVVAVYNSNVQLYFISSTESAQEGIENVVLTEKANKVMVDGMLYIVRDGKMYNVQGARVR